MPVTAGDIAVLVVEILLGLAIPAAVAFAARVMRKISAIEEVVCGREANPLTNAPAVSPIAQIVGEVASRLDAVEKQTRQLEPNGGSRVADAVHRTEAAVGTLTARFDDHVHNHPGPGAP